MAEQQHHKLTSKQKEQQRLIVLRQREAALRAKFSNPWIKDEDSRSCFLCRKEFNFLYRRKHHCRRCGQVFCSQCSNYFLSSLMDPQNETSIDKDTRLCRTCFLYCKEFIESDQSDPSEEQQPEGSDDEELYPAENSSHAIHRELKQTFETKARLLIQYVFTNDKKLQSLSVESIDEAFEFALHSVKNVRLRKLSSQKLSKYHEMDVNQNIMIRTALHKDAYRMRTINGIISAKNVAKKNMCISFGVKKDKSLNMNSGSGISKQRTNSNQASFDSSSGLPSNSALQIHSQQQNSGVRCMVINVSVDLFSHNEANFPDLQQIIQRQRAHVQKIVEGFKQYKPQIIFCKENVNQEVLAALESASITVVQKIKERNILRIAECAGCKIVNDIASILPRTMSNGQPQPRSQSQAMLDMKLLGTLTTAYFKTYQFAANQKTYMFLEQSNKSTPQHISMLITGPQLETLRHFKKSLQVILRLVRHLYLEQEIIFGNHEILKANKKAKKVYVASLENDFVDFGNLNNFLDEKMGLQDYLASDSQKYSYMQISYAKTEWDQFDNVASKEEFEKYVSEKKLDYDRMKINTLVKYCEDFQLQQLNFYQMNDTTLGDMLLKLYNERNTACNNCKRPKFNHYLLYFRYRSYVRLSVIERLDPTLAANSSSQPTTAPSGSSSSSSNHHQSASSPHSHSPFSDQQQQAQNRRKKQSQKDFILSYIRCEQCNQCITPVHTSQFSKTFMEYSYSRFLQHMFQEHSESYKRDRPSLVKEQRPLPGESQMTNTTMIPNKCQHTVRSRVFNIKDVEIQFQCGLTSIFSIKRVNMSSEGVTANVREADTDYYRDGYISMKLQLKSLIFEAMARLNKLADQISKKRTNKMVQLVYIQDLIRNYIDQMEREKDLFLQNFDAQSITSYKSVMLLFILEQRIHTGIARLHQLEKEIVKKKYKQFEKQAHLQFFPSLNMIKTFINHSDEAIVIDQDNSLLMDEEITELNQSMDEQKTLKGYQVTMNVQEERQKQDEQQQPFDYIPVYQKNQLSMISWALNTKTYGRFLKDHGLSGSLSVSRTYLIDSLRRSSNGSQTDDKQAIEENKLVIRMMRCPDTETLFRFDGLFADANLNLKQPHQQSSQQQQQQQPLITPQLINMKPVQSSNTLEPSSDQLNLITPVLAVNHTNGTIEENPLEHQQSHSHKSNHLDSGNELDHIEGSKRIHAEAFNDFDDEWPKFKSSLKRSHPEGLGLLSQGDNVKKYLSRDSLQRTSLLPPRGKSVNSLPSKQFQRSLNNLFYKTDEEKLQSTDQVTEVRHSSVNSATEIPKDSSSASLQQLPHTAQVIAAPVTEPSSPTKVSNHSSTHSSLNLNFGSRSDATTLLDNMLVEPTARIPISKQMLWPSENTSLISSEVCGEIHVMFAKQFEALRNLHGISLERIVESLRTCQAVKLPGGQTQSAFVKSHDELFVVKEVTALEFNYFCEFAPAYFEHISIQVPHSILSKIFGMFEIWNGDEKRCYSVMENLFYGVDKESCLSYDLKGSKLRRFNKKTDIGLDTNFIIDQNCEPLFIDNSAYQQFDKTIRADSDFLAQQGIVDYSLLLIVDKQKKSLRMGIIDYFRKFDFYKIVEQKFKTLVYREDPTIIQPRKYQERFAKTITKKFFCKL